MRYVRGQSAVEYLMTYGWAILIILVVGVVVYQMGFFDQSRSVTRDKRGFSQVVPLDWSMTPAGDLAVVVQNNAGSIVRLQSAGASITAGGSDACSLDGAAPGVPLDTFRPGATQTIKFVGCKLSPGMLGDYYRVNLTVSYDNPASGLPHVSNGIIWGPVG